MLEDCSKNLVKVGRAVRIVGNPRQSIEEQFINSSAQLKACREQSQVHRSRKHRALQRTIPAGVSDWNGDDFPYSL